jgi:dethiobiotin synthetase
LKLPLILVTGSYLGTLSHTLTALDVLRQRELSVLTIVVNETEGSTVPLDETVATLARFVQPIGVLPVARMAPGAADPAAFAAMFGSRPVR